MKNETARIKHLTLPPVAAMVNQPIKFIIMENDKI